MVSVLLTNFGAPSSATVKRTTKGSDFENLSLLGRPRAPRIKVIAILISSQQCLGQFVWNPSSHNPKVYTLLSIRNCPQQPFISDLCSPFPSGQSTIEDFKFSHLITWGETSLLSRGIFQPLKSPVLDIFLLLSLFWTIIIRVSYRAVNKQTFAGA